MLCFIDFGSIPLSTAVPRCFRKLRFQNIGIGFLRFGVCKIFQGILPFSGDKPFCRYFLNASLQHAALCTVVAAAGRLNTYIHPYRQGNPEEKSADLYSYAAILCSLI